MWIHGRSEGELTKGGGKKLSVDEHVTKTGADREGGSNDPSAEEGRANVDKNAEGRVSIAVYVPVTVWGM